MRFRKPMMRAAWVLLFIAAMAGAMGQQCSISGLPFPVQPVVDTVDLEFINNAPFDVDPGLFVDGVAYVIDPLLAPGDSFGFAPDCFEGTILETDATLFDPVGAIASDNITLLTEGVDFTCGDVVTYVYSEDAAGFFTQVLVNGVLVAP